MVGEWYGALNHAEMSSGRSRAQSPPQPSPDDAAMLSKVVRDQTGRPLLSHYCAAPMI